MSVVLIVEGGTSILRGLRKTDMVILDLMLPDLSGLEVYRKLREDGFTKRIVMLTARSGESGRKRGLGIGAEGYINKPFSNRELLARVQTLLGPAEVRLERPEILRFDDVEIDFKSFETRKCGVALALTPKEYALLRVLASRPGEAVSREELLTEVWGYKNLPTTRTVDTHIGTLRAKLEDDAAEPTRLITVHGVGYKLTL
jgi:DNA-binding response OmpR family regulator